MAKKTKTAKKAAAPRVVHLGIRVRETGAVVAAVTFSDGASKTVQAESVAALIDQIEIA